LDYISSGFYSQAENVDKSITSRDYRLFLQQLRATRKRAGVTQVDLAKRLKETQSFVSKCERGERRLDIIEVRAFCRAIGVSMKSFLQDLENLLTASERSLRSNIPKQRATPRWDAPMRSKGGLKKRPGLGPRTKEIEAAKS